MARKTRMSPAIKIGKLVERKKMKPKNAHSSLLMMLSSQLLGTGRFNEGLPSFIMRGLDCEQIWQQLELRNEHKLSFPTCTREVVRISSGVQRNAHKDKNQKLKQNSATPVDTALDIGDNQENSESENSDEEDGILSSIKKRLTEETFPSNDDELAGFSDSDDQNELDFDFQLDNEISKGISDDEQEEIGLDKSVKEISKKSDKTRTSVVDDKFFKLAEAEQFLDSEDVKEEKRRQREEKGKDRSLDDDSDDSEEVDMFDDQDSDSDDAQGAKYQDFFDPPGNDISKKGKEEKLVRKSKVKESEQDEANSENSESDMDDDNESADDAGEHDSEVEEQMNDESLEKDDEQSKSEGKGNNKKVSFTSDLLESDDETNTQTDTKLGKSKSAFELKQEQLQAKAREMEELSLKEASWELTGEVTSSKRPENSLLDTVLDFQHTAKAAPVITDETTKTLEDYIKQRIKDKTFDDVERKDKPKEDVFEFKKRIVLDQEKSKQSLGELYEQEFLKQQQTQSDEVKADPECETIEKNLNKLFHQLDALSNFRYTPMRPGTEVKIIVNTPAIAMEEVAPVATADSELLAPEEIFEKKKGDLKATDERSATDMKRARRHKKIEKRERKKAKEAREKVVDKLKPGLGNKYSKAKALKQLEQISKMDRNVTVIKGDHKKLSSSASFFSQLQDEVQTNAKTKKAVKDKKKKPVNADKLML